MADAIASADGLHIEEEERENLRRSFREDVDEPMNRMNRRHERTDGNTGTNRPRCRLGK